MTGHFGEVFQLECQAHAEHHQAQQRHDGDFQADEPLRLQECQYREKQYPVSEGVADKAAQCSQCAHDLILIIKNTEY
ncbi:hypothetical protein D3C78_1359940 [compost metagenome]